MNGNGTADAAPPDPEWTVPGTLEMYANLGWIIVVAWVYVTAALLFIITMAVRLVHHVFRHYPAVQWLPNIITIMAFPVTATMCTAAVFDPRFIPMLDILRDEMVGLHLATMGFVLITACNGREQLIATISQVWQQTGSGPTADSRPGLSPTSHHLCTKYWWIFEPQKNARLLVLVHIACMIQYPVVLTCVHGYLLSLLVGPLFNDPDHFLWTGIPPDLNAIVLMSFWLCFIGRNAIFGLPLPMLEWGDLMRDRERTMFLVLDFNWLQAFGTVWFPEVGVQLPGMNPYTSYSVVLHGVVVLQLAASVMRLDRFWREPLHVGLNLPPIAERIAARNDKLIPRRRNNDDGGSAGEVVDQRVQRAAANPSVIVRRHVNGETSHSRPSV